MTALRTASTALVVTLGLAQGAAAEPRSFTALKDKFASNALVVVSADLKPVRGLASWPKLVDGFKQLDNDIGQAFDLVKSTCQIDLATAVADVTFIVGESGGVFALALDGGLDEPKALACANKVAKSMKQNAITGKVNGKVTEYSMAGQNDKLTVAWVGKDVVVIDLGGPEQRRGLDAALAGSAPTGDLAAQLKLANTGAVLFGAGALGNEEVKNGVGAVTLAKGVFTGALRLTMKDAKHQKEALAEGQKELKSEITKLDSSTKTGAKTAAKILKGLKLKGSGAADITLDGSVTEADLAEVLPQLEHLF